MNQAPTTRELTIRALLLGISLAIVLGAANTYLGLYAGMTVSASIPAAVISMAILRGVFRSGTIKENNIVQSVASAGESLAAGVIFTVPAILLVGGLERFRILADDLDRHDRRYSGRDLYDPPASRADHQPQRPGLSRRRGLRRSFTGRGEKRRRRGFV